MGTGPFEQYLDLLEKHGATMRRSAIRRMAGVPSRQNLTDYRRDNPTWKAREAEILSLLRPIVGAQEGKAAAPVAPAEGEATPPAGDESSVAPDPPPSAATEDSPGALTSEQRRFIRVLRAQNDRIKACSEAHVTWRTVKGWMSASREFRERYEDWWDELKVQNEDTIGRGGANGEVTAARAFLAANVGRYRRGEAEGGSRTGDSSVNDHDVSREHDTWLSDLGARHAGLRQQVQAEKEASSDA